MNQNKISKEQAKAVIAEIVRQSVNDELKGKVRLYKAFYLAHLYYAVDNSDYLTEWPIVRMPMGPGIDGFPDLIEELVDDKVLTEREDREGPFKTNVYCFVSASVPELNETQKAAVKKAVGFISDKTGSQLSDITHEYSRSWTESNNGEELRIYFDLLDDDEYDECRKNSEIVKSAMNDVWE